MSVGAYCKAEYDPAFFPYLVVCTRFFCYTWTIEAFCETGVFVNPDLCVRPGRTQRRAPVMCKCVYAVVLAAGMSTRMGSPKQLLPFGDKTVLQRVLDALLEADLDGIVVVLGHGAEEVRESVEGRRVDFCMNRDYRKGMFSSILCGISAVSDSADAALIVLGDQPRINARVVRRVVGAYREEEKGLVVPTFGGKRGHPALVDLRKYRAEIAGLSGEAGLKPVMRGHPEDTLELAVEEGWILQDMDTPEDYQAELERQKAEGRRQR